MAYLGFQKGGAKCLLATSAHTRGGANQVFQFCYNVEKKLGQRGMADLAKGEYATGGFRVGI